MKRRTTHALFASMCLGTALLAGQQGWSLHRTEQANIIVQQLAQVSSTSELATVGQFAASLATVPRVQLALANAEAREGDLARAERAFNELIRGHDEQAVGQSVAPPMASPMASPMAPPMAPPMALSARYNLANRYLREAMGATGQHTARPLLELAKQRYRDLLRISPHDWNTRYNLEQALRLAPERPDAFESSDMDPVKSVNVVVPGFDPKNLP